MVLGGIDAACRRLGEPAVEHAALHAGEFSLVAEQGDGGRGLDECLGQAGDDLGRGVGKAVQNPHESWVDVVAAKCPPWSGAPGEAKQVIAFLKGQAQPPGDRIEHLL